MFRQLQRTFAADVERTRRKLRRAGAIVVALRMSILAGCAELGDADDVAESLPAGAECRTDVWSDAGLTPYKQIIEDFSTFILQLRKKSRSGKRMSWMDWLDDLKDLLDEI